MKKNLIFFFLVFGLFQANAQKDLKVTLEPDSPLNTDFFIDEIIDARVNKENIGVAQRGAFNKQVPAHFSEDFVTHLKGYFDALLPKEENKTPLILKVHQLYISERTAAMSELGTCEVQLEFLKDENGKQFSLGTFSSQVEKGGMDATAGHPKRIKQAIQNCLEEFAKSEWKNTEMIAAGDMEPAAFEPQKELLKGLYMNFADLKSNKPKNDISYYTQMIAKDKKSEHYMVYHNGKKKRVKNLFGFSDGENIYLNATRYTQKEYFVKSMLKGRYIYFEDHYSSTIAAASFGVVGALASMKHTGIILDTKTGITSVLNNKNMEDLLVNYPALKEEYAKTDKRVEDDRLMIQKINELEKSQSI